MYCTFLMCEMFSLYFFASGFFYILFKCNWEWSWAVKNVLFPFNCPGYFLVLVSTRIFNIRRDLTMGIINIRRCLTLRIIIIGRASLPPATYSAYTNLVKTRNFAYMEYSKRWTMLTEITRSEKIFLNVFCVYVEFSKLGLLYLAFLRKEIKHL